MLPLYEKLLEQIGERKDVEVLCLIDNKSMTIGEKRNKILSCARGQYVSFLDDDDMVSDDFVSSILEVIDKGQNYDVISFKQHCTVNGKQFHVDFHLTNPNEQAILFNGEYRDIKRKPYHMCVWKSILAKNTMFPESSYGEDLAWITQLCVKCKSEHHIDKVMHYYRFSDETSASIQHRNTK